MNKLTKFFHLPFHEKIILAEAIFFLFLSKLLLIILPFRICLKILKSKEYYGVTEHKVLKEIRSSILRANRLSFWDNVCLVQSFAARCMLNRRKINSIMFIGVSASGDQNKIKAHAWIISQDFEIVRKESEYEVLLEI